MISLLSGAAAILASASAIVGLDVRLQGAGATFPNPLYQRWVSEFQKSHPDVRIDYQSIGSGGGVKAITEKTVQFAGSDAPLNKKELAALGGADDVVQIPTCAGAVVPAYNLPGVTGEVKFTGEILADVFMGKISNWNDPRLAEINKGITLPDLAITPAWRSDGSGTTFVWTNYLATQSETFKGGVGTGKQVAWPIGQGGKGNEGVSAIVQQTPGSLGYIELNYATANKIAFGSIKNTAGRFVRATPESVSAAGAGVAEGLTGTVLAADLWNQPIEAAYPAAAFTYIIVYKDLRTVKTASEAEALVSFLWWATHDGQALAVDLDYAPLAKPVQDRVGKAIKAITFQGQPLHAADR
ncbi:MAG: phosphate ABC transporter substrate-binding protein PstS [Phycisphaeraceae bacterium]|nr:phosphate ABC transporter substrate-binding protein PstS [Phycisphaeraceae bacterium]